MIKKMLAAAAVAATMIVSASAQGTPTTTPGSLPLGVSPVSYNISVEPNPQALTFAGTVDIVVDIAAPTREIVLNAAGISFDSVRVGSARATVSLNETDQTARLSFNRNLRAGRNTLSIAYRGQIQQQSFGLFAVDYDVEGGTERMLSTQFEAADARRFVPSWDEPSSKATFQLAVVVPENRMAVSNMPEARVERLSGGRKRVHFQPSPVMSSYLLFLAVGDFERISTNVAGIDIGVITKRGDSERGRFALQTAAQVVPYFNEYFGAPYPLPKLDMIAVPGAGGFGAMENWGAIMYFESAILIDPALSAESRRQGVFGTVAHEIAHQWFGDLVTMAWWDDLWLNEGYASWMAAKAAEHFYPDWGSWMQAQRRRQDATEQDSRVTTHPIVQQIRTVAEASEAFDNITYRKGAAVIRMLETYVGEDAFRAGVRDYMQAHDYGNARTADLWNAIERASGQPMRAIAEDFTNQAGVPLINVEAGACENGRRTLTLTQGRYGLDAPSREARRWRVPVSAQSLDGGATQRAVTADGRATLTMPNCGAFVVNPDQVGYFRVAYQRATFDQLSREFARLTPSDQLGLLYDTRALSEAGLSPYSDFFALARQTPADADPLVWDLIAEHLGKTDSLYAGLETRAAYRTFARGVLSPVLARIGWDATPGEPDNNGILRAQLINSLSLLGDTQTALEARRRFASGQIPGGIRQATLTALGRSADAAVFDALLARARETRGTLEKDGYYTALMSASDPVIAARALDIAFTADVPVTKSANYIAIVAEQHPALAWRFVMEHPAEIEARLDSLRRADFTPGLTANGVDDALLAELRAYIDRDVAADVRRGAEADYLRLQDRIATRREKLPQLDTWLRGPGRNAAGATGRGR
jgi:aminopeptidase N